MKLSVFPVFAAASAVLLFGACEGDQPARSTGIGGFHPPVQTPAAANPDTRPHDAAAPAQDAMTSKPPSHSPEPPKTTADTKPRNPIPDVPSSSSGNPPYAKPVPGKPGFVTNPFDASNGYIDARGFPPGTEVKDPSTGKTFLVP
jgi:hypothetical protein